MKNIKFKWNKMKIWPNDEHIHTVVPKASNDNWECVCFCGEK